MRYFRNDAVMAQDIDDQVILLNSDQTALMTLNPTGAAIWNALEEPGSVDEVVSRVLPSFPDADVAVVHADAVTFLDRLVELDIATTGS